MTLHGCDHGEPSQLRLPYCPQEQFYRECVLFGQVTQFGGPPLNQAATTTVASRHECVAALHVCRMGPDAMTLAAVYAALHHLQRSLRVNASDMLLTHPD